MKLHAFVFSALMPLCVLLISCEFDIPAPTEDPPEVTVTENRVDLRPQQTAIKNQGSRNSCQTFAAIAALEASYKRLGYGDKDLSEEFLNYMRKNFWLHTPWSDVLAREADGTENQVGAFGGGGGAHCVRLMFGNGLRVPVETDMPYRTDDYASNPNKFPWTDARYDQQWNVNNFNLDPDNLPRRLLHSDRFHGAATGRFFPDKEDARSPRAIENVLRRRMEVVWDFSGNIKISDIWRPCESGESGCTGDIAHSMLIVGFDRTDPDPSRHYFMVKNSWGADDPSTSDSLGFTYISYEMIRRFGNAMAYIEIPRLVVDQWEDVQIIGRYNLLFDGHEAVLDIYHLPGYWDAQFLGGLNDRRLGTLRIGSKMYRVNGAMDGNKITFYLDTDQPNLPWDRLQGRRVFEYYFSSDDYMAGFHTDANGNEYGGVAIKTERVPAGSGTPRPFSYDSYTHSAWSMKMGEREGVVYLHDKEEHPYSPGNFHINGFFQENGSSDRSFFELWLAEGRSDFSHVSLHFELDGESVTLDGRHLNHSPGVIAGRTVVPLGEAVDPFYMTRRQ